MAGVGFILTIDDVDLRGRLGALPEVDGGLTPLLEDWGAELEFSTVERFATNIAPDGTPWAPSLRAKLTGTPTLVLTGRLRDSIHYFVEPEAVEVGSNVIYAAAHQVGVTIHAAGDGLAFRLADGGFVITSSVDLPQREYLGLSTRDGEKLIEIAQDHRARALRLN